MWVLIIWLLSALWGAPACLSWAKAQHWVKNPKLFLIILWFHWPYFASRNTLLFFFSFFQDSATAVSSPWNVLFPEYCKVVTSYHSIIIPNVTSSEVHLTHGLFAKLSYWFCISQQIFLKWYLSNRYCSMFPEYKEEIIMMSLLSRNSNFIHTIST